MPARTKEEYEEVINKLLGTGIKWRKLSLEELIEFSVLLDHPELFMGKLGVTTSKTEKEIAAAATMGPVLSEAVEVLSLWKEHGQGPFAKLFRKIQDAKAQAKT